MKKPFLTVLIIVCSSLLAFSQEVYLDQGKSSIVQNHGYWMHETADDDSATATQRLLDAFWQGTWEFVISRIDTFVIDSDSVELFAMELRVDGVLDQYIFWRIDSNLVKMYGVQEVGEDPVFWPDPFVFTKATGLVTGDSWYGTLPDFLTFEEIVQETTVTMNGTSYQVMEIAVRDTNGNYAGQKWVGDGVGLVGWHLENQGTKQSLELQSYSLSGGYGYFPLAVGNNWQYTRSVESPRFPAPIADITVDGNMLDWSQLDPAIQDPEGDDPSPYTGTDIKDVYIAVDSVNLYLMANFWDGTPNSIWGQMSSFAYQFHIYITEDSGEGESIGASHDGMSWYLNGHNVNVSNATVACNNVIEIAIPLADIFNPAELIRYFLQIGTGLNDYDITGSVSVQLASRGDANGDREIDFVDLVHLLEYIYRDGDPSDPLWLADVNCDQIIDWMDVLYLIDYIFRGGPPPGCP